MPLRAILAGLALSLAFASAALADTTVAFYSHGWGVRLDGYTYYPHAFIVVRRQAAPDDAPTTDTYGFTALSQGLEALAGPTPGVVKSEPDVYRRQARLHFTVTVTDAQYQALQAVVAAWGGPGAPLYELHHHNCVGFAAAMAQAAGLRTPAEIGMDPGKFLAEVKALNPDRLAAAP